jgi:hypothetical protein
MGIQNLNRFHWILLGAFLGAALAYAWVGAANTTENISPTDQTTFESEVIQKDPQQRPLISGIVVHPPVYSPADGAKVNQVSYKRLATDKVSGRTDYFAEHWFVARIPFRPRLNRVQIDDASTFDVRAYLTALAKVPNNDFIKYRDGWWLMPKNAVMAGAGAGVVVIGGIWPTLLSVMAGAGLAPKRQPREKGVSLWNYKSKGAESKARRPAVTAQDQARLGNVADAYEKNLAGSGIGMTHAGADAPAAHADKKKPAVLRPLENKKLDEVPKTGEEEDTELKYKEYYPVVVHHKKPHDEHAAHDPKKPAP